VFGAFSPGDSLQVYRLQRKGVSLDLQRSLMRPYKPLWEAWLAFLTQHAMGQPTYVLYDAHDGEAFIQVRYRPHQAAADVAFLAPALSEHQRAATAWTHLLDGAGIEAAGQGIQRVFANLPTSGAEVDVFHQVGFTLYAEEEVYCRPPQPMAAQAPDGPGLRPLEARDWPAIQKLCVAITPQRVRQAEGGIVLASGWEQDCQRYVLPAESGDDLLASLTICPGGQLHWLRVLLHPDARHLAGEVIHWGLASLADQSTKAIYCNVRQYENGVREALQATDFAPYATRSLMVKHTVAWVKLGTPEPLPALKSGVEPVPPAYRLNDDPEIASSKGQLAIETQGE
jgi:hypothetical protein